MRRLLLQALFTIIVSLGNAESIPGCAPNKNSVSKGFDVSYYHYPLIPRKGDPKCFDFDPIYTQDSYLHGGYQTYGGGLLGTSHAVVDLSFKSNINDRCSLPTKANMPTNYNYNQPITLTNFSMLITGYFYAQKSGSYEFMLDVDDLAYVNIGAGSAFDCCNREISVSDPGPFDLSAIWPASKKSATVNLSEGFYYPLRIFYINRQGIAGLSVSFKDADGIIHENFDGYIYSAPDGNECPAIATTTTIPWTGTITSTYTTISTITGSDHKPSTTSIVIVETPEVETATTEYTPWTGTYTSTYSTDVVTVTGSDGVPTVETTFHVETPEIETATTVNTPWTGTYTSTYSTDVVTVTGSDGVPTVETTFHVETPEIETATTEYIPWTGTYSTTYSTDVVTVTGSDGVPTVETTFHVETPEIETATTEYTPWTGTYSTTYSTDVVTVTGSDGVPTVETTFHVETPEIETATTVNTPWTGTYTSTYSTDVVTVTGSDGVPTVETTFHVETPISSSTTLHYSNSTASTLPPMVSTITVSSLVTTYTTAEPSNSNFEITTSQRSTFEESGTTGPTFTDSVSVGSKSETISTVVVTSSNFETTFIKSNTATVTATHTLTRSENEILSSGYNHDTIKTDMYSTSSKSPTKTANIPIISVLTPIVSSTASIETNFEGKASKLVSTSLLAILLAFL
ncbi:flocculation protein FLO9 [Kluyveromyces marxianus]|uniref:Flocculation protein FLO9 n=1 Tax=Kluyveromyces marxianus TaxID=4911 RepID=A0ABX6F2J9_KLUMA|nr:flocculation protein FLO9 [Kluyveromyces marxianus]